jgi:hypothetical protein
MSGTSIPYHLRQNKAIDRYAFLELLSKIDRYCPISEYQYIGFGGYSLEDFKYIHSRFDICDMLSIEKDENVYQRQSFNNPHSCINCHHKSSEDFISEFQKTKPTIIWLDYVKPSELRTQIEEFQNTLNKLSDYDIIKLTVNSHASSYVSSQQGINPSELQELRINKLKEMLGELFPSADVKAEMMTEKRFAEGLYLIIKYSARLAVRGKVDLYFQPLTAFSYADGQQMLTVTGILLNTNKTEDFFEKTKLKQWQLSSIDVEKPHRINVPDLTIKERLTIDSLLPNANPEEIQNQLGFLFDKKEKISLEMLHTYIFFYRQSPYFSRIVI